MMFELQIKNSTYCKKRCYEVDISISGLNLCLIDLLLEMSCSDAANGGGLTAHAFGNTCRGYRAGRRRVKFGWLLTYTSRFQTARCAFPLPCLHATGAPPHRLEEPETGLPPGFSGANFAI